MGTRVAQNDRPAPPTSNPGDIVSPPGVPHADAAQSEAGFAIFDKNLRLVAWNDAFFTIQKLPRDFAERGRKYEDFLRFVCALQDLGIGETERQTASLISQLQGTEPIKCEWRRSDETAVRMWAIPVYGGGLMCTASPIGSDGVADDFLSNTAAACSRHDVLDALDSMADGFALFDQDDRLVFCNNNFRAIHDRVAQLLLPGISYANLLKAAFEAEQFSEDGPNAEELYEIHKRARRGNSETFELELSDRRWLQCSETRSADGSIICIRSDITEVKKHAQELSGLGEQLTEQNLHFNTALNNMAQGLCLFDAEQQLIVCNKRYLEIFGFSPDVVKPGIKLREIMEYSISLGNYASDEANSALSDRPNVASKSEQSVLEQWLSDGRVIAVLHQPMQGGGSVATYEDITERRMSEQRLTEHAEELEKTNAELQNFAYVASHDLQEPLRKIESFGSRLQKRCGDELGESGLQYLERMQDAATRMRTLINDLLTYSRLSSKEVELEWCDLNQIAREVVSDLEINIAETQATVSLDELPLLEASPTQMRQLFQNLFTNALKFTRPDVKPVVQVSARTFNKNPADVPGATRRVCEIVISDNGIGFDAKYADQIFGIFQRLHGRAAYEGTGIGLATCRRVVERHGGTIQAVGTLGEGAAFHIELPMTSSQ